MLLSKEALPDVSVLTANGMDWMFVESTDMTTMLPQTRKAGLTKLIAARQRMSLDFTIWQTAMILTSCKTN